MKHYQKCAFTLCYLFFMLPAAGQDTKPNLILIMADDVGIEAFRTYGGEDYKTPFLDKLASQGMQFNHCYSQPICTPSRVKIMTGKSNVRNYRAFSILDPRQKTFGHLLQKAGYKTAVTGKWQLYGAEHYGELAGTGIQPKDAGFDTWCLWQVDKLGSRYHNPRIDENGLYLKDTKGKYGPDLFTDFAVRFIHENKNHPFFLYYPMVLVHDPFVPTPDSHRNTKKKFTKKENFIAMINYMDKKVGRIIKEVESCGLENNTLILFIADNGTNKRITSQWRGQTIRGGKGLPTDAGTHVPMFARWPGKIAPNISTNALVEFSDFLPTLLDAAGEKIPSNLAIDGVSFLPVLLGKKQPKRESIFIYSNPRPTRKGIGIHRFARNQSWKLYSNGHLFHISKDRFEQYPILEGAKQDQPKIRLLLQKKINSMPAVGQNLLEKSSKNR